MQYAEAPLDAPEQRAFLVVGKVMPGLLPDESADPGKVIGKLRLERGGPSSLDGLKIRRVLAQLTRPGMPSCHDSVAIWHDEDFCHSRRPAPGMRQSVGCRLERHGTEHAFATAR